MIRIVIDLPNGPNNLNEIGNITTAALSANARISIENQQFIPAASLSGEVPAIPADAVPAPRIEDFAHAAAGNLADSTNNTSNGGRSKNLK